MCPRGKNAPHSVCAAVAMKNSRQLGMKQTCPGLRLRQHTQLLLCFTCWQISGTFGRHVPDRYGILIRRISANGI